MELTIQKEVLMNGIQCVQNAITQKSSLPILSNVLIEATDKDFKMIATDLDIGICATFPVIATQPGAVTIPAKKFFDIVRSLPDGEEVNLSIKKNNSISIRSGKAQFKIFGLPKEDFPPLPLFEDKDSITIPQAMLKDMLNLTEFAISRDDTRHQLAGIFLTVKESTICAVATDGRRMAVVNRKLPKKTLVEREVIIPVKTILEARRLLGDDGDVKIEFSENQILLSFGASFIISRLIEGDFPDYKKVIPEKSKNVISISREELLQATRRVSIFTDQESQAIKLNIQKTKLTISKNTPYLGEAREEIKADYSGSEEVEIGFNPRYLIDVLKSLNDQDIFFEVNDSSKPGVIRKEDSYVYVVLPMQVLA